MAVIHPSSEPIDERERGLYLKNAKASLKVLADRAQELGLILAVENLPRTCLCRDSEETAQILKSDDRLRFCFDVNHLLIDSHARFLERFARQAFRRCIFPITILRTSGTRCRDAEKLTGASLFCCWKRLITAVRFCTR